MKSVKFLLLALVLSGCTSVGTLGIVAKSTINPGLLLREAQPYKELGQVQDKTCRFFLLGVAPWGDATLSTAVDNALTMVRGDALINVAVSNSLYGFFPLYNVLAFTCTEVKGTAIRFEKLQKKTGEN